MPDRDTIYTAFVWFMILSSATLVLVWAAKDDTNYSETSTIDRVICYSGDNVVVDDYSYHSSIRSNTSMSYVSAINKNKIHIVGNCTLVINTEMPVGAKQYIAGVK